MQWVADVISGCQRFTSHSLHQANSNIFDIAVIFGGYTNGGVFMRSYIGNSDPNGRKAQQISSYPTFDLDTSTTDS